MLWCIRSLSNGCVDTTNQEYILDLTLAVFLYKGKENDTAIIVCTIM